MARAHFAGRAIVALDVDTTTPGGKLVTHVMASVAEWERETIGARTKDALAAKRAQGVRLGRPPTLLLDVLQRISRDRAKGTTVHAIADGLTADAVPTVQGVVRRPGTVAAVPASQDVQPASV